MALDLSDYVESLQREVIPPGSNLFANVDATAWAGYLSDAFWEARLDGFLTGYSADDDGAVTRIVDTVPEDMPRQYVALVVLYAGIRVLRNKILNTQTSFRAKAGPVEYETQNGATMLAEMLKQLAATKNRLIEAAEQTSDVNTTVVAMFDAYSTRLFEPVSYFGGPELVG